MTTNESLIRWLDSQTDTPATFEFLLGKPVTVFVTIPNSFDEVHQFDGELIGFDHSGLMLRSGMKPMKWRFFPRERIARIENQ